MDSDPVNLEVELKLALEPASRAAFGRSAALAGAARARRRLRSVYFDTPDCQLARHGMALRLRRSGTRWIEGLKAANEARGGLQRRQEWEFERGDAGIDLAHFAGTPLAALEDGATLHTRLVAAFEVRVTRSTWELRPAPGVRLEVALDAGVVEGGGRRERISEVEIECLEGSHAAAFELAERLLDDARLRPSLATKAERGYRLFRGEARRPLKARRPELTCTMSAEEAARRVVAAGLEQWLGNEEGVIATEDAEFVHQARVALRRLRAALRMLRAPIGGKRAARWRASLAGLARTLGAARDWDVFAAQTFPALAAEHGDGGLVRSLGASIARRCRAERRAARAALRAGDHSRTLLAIARWASEESAPAAADVDLVAFASRLLRKRHRRLLRDAADVANLSAPERHRLRIDAKRLRYGTDALAALFMPGPTGEYLDALSGLQDALGRANDAATALRLVAELHPPEAFMALARARLAAQAVPRTAQVEALLARLAAHRPFR